MTDAIREQLSAFVDGELSSTEAALLLKRVERDVALGDALDRYQLIGEALRNEQVTGPSHDFASRVAAAVAQSGQADSVKGRVWQRTRAWARPAVGGAIAASVIAATILAYPLLNAERAGADHGYASASETAAPLGDDNLVTIIPAEAVRASQAERAAAERFGNDTPVLRVTDGSRLAGYVMAHSEYSSPLGRRNVLTGLLAEESPAEQTESSESAIVIPER